MRYSVLRARLRDARHRASLSQAALAARSGTSRVTIARVEAGVARDVRLGTIERLCAALDLQLAAVPAVAAQPPLVETLLARERDKTRRLELRAAHAAIAARLLASPAEASTLIRRARAAVDRWERERLCSHHYVHRWREKLAGPASQVARGLLEPGPWQDALFQSSPWSFALAGAHA